MRSACSSLPALLLVAAPSLPAQLGVHPEEARLQPKIDTAIGRGVESLLESQQRDGSWGVHAHIGGRAGLCAYTLIKCGLDKNHPALRRAFAYLDSVEPDKTYAVACMMLAYAAMDPVKYEDRLKRLLEKLLDWQRSYGTWAYPHGTPDLSNTQYAALGLWAADVAGLQVPTKAWNKLIDGTLRYREEPRYVDVKISKKTETGKRRVAGFKYRAGNVKGHGAHATGSMTGAGVAILKICEIGLGEKLRKSARRRIEDGIEGGLNWLAAHFAVNKNPGKGGGWVLYYLYGLERVGSLVRQEQFGDHWWYLQGARHLLKEQGKRARTKVQKGQWSNPTDTCFALLFLRRATDISRPTTGSPTAKTRSFRSGGPKDDIHLRGAGQQPLALYIDRFGKALLEKHKALGLRIVRVEYWAGKRKLGQLAADPTRPWKNDTFVLQVAALPRGSHKVEARVIALAPDASPDGDGATVTIKSKPMEVSIRDIFEPWMEEAATMQRGNLLRRMRPKVTTSSGPEEAKFLTDNNDATAWLASPDDDVRTVTLQFPRTLKVRRLVVTQPIGADVGTIEELEVTWDKRRKPLIVKMHIDRFAPTDFSFPKLIPLRSLKIRISRFTGGKRVGFSEIVLKDTRKKKPMK